MSLLIICGACSKTVVPGGGAVLSCGDFLCESCIQHQNGRVSQCLACGKQGVRIAPLNSQIPEEVRQNIADPAQGFEGVYNVVCFQLKYYKQTIKRLQNKLEMLEAEKHGLQTKLDESQRPRLMPSQGTFFQQTSNPEDNVFMDSRAPSPISPLSNSSQSIRTSSALGNITSFNRSNSSGPQVGNMGQPPQGSRRYGFAPGSPSRESIRSQNSLYDDRASSVGTQESNAISSRSTVTSRHFGGSEAGGEGRPINSRIRSPHPPIVRSPLMQLNSLPTRTSNPIGNQAPKTAPAKTSTPIQSFIMHNFK